ncbi:uncharacterized protein LOC111944288 isoform X7 [Cyanistes caeruleus]|uniref:uncharacterized protein LOC111944288 isoform X7 n=1 Tax=Cyanistes caeruleus TaxID=156563 RepID=UPI000CDAA026|nr:uncharacterized protein LOC111944288 isoform X7 [Cyanistes caeruleus]
MNINRVLLGNERATAKLLFNVMKSELEKDKLHQLKWQERVKVWKLIQKNCIVQSFREFTASEEIQNPPTVKTEMENMIKEQIVLSDQRLRVLQHIGFSVALSWLLGRPKEAACDITFLWPVQTLSHDTPNVECMEKMCIQYELVQDKCQEKVQVCKSEFKEMAKWHEQHCEGLYNYVQDAMALWDVHQLQLSQQENVLQKKVDECRWEEDNIIQMMEDNLDTSLEKMKMASCEEELKQYLEKALSSLDQIRTSLLNSDLKLDRNEKLKQIVMDEVMAYPKAILWELISYSISISQHFSVKEISKQNLQGTIDSTVQDQNNTSTVQTGLEARTSQPRAEQDNGLSQLVPEDRDSCQKSAGETNLTEKQVILAQEIAETEEEEDEESVPHKSEENEHAEQGLSIMQVSEQENTFESEGSLDQNKEE